MEPSLTACLPSRVDFPPHQPPRPRYYQQYIPGLLTEQEALFYTTGRYNKESCGDWKMDNREQRGLALAALYRIEQKDGKYIVLGGLSLFPPDVLDYRIEQKDGKYIVPSQSGNGTTYAAHPNQFLGRRPSSWAKGRFWAKPLRPPPEVSQGKSLGMVGRAHPTKDREVPPILSHEPTALCKQNSCDNHGRKLFP
jgi:hypothetical protein